MPKILTPRKLIVLLKQNGFLLKRQKGSHLIFYHSRTKRRVIVPFHTKDLPKGTLHAILKESGIHV